MKPKPLEKSTLIRVAGTIASGLNVQGMSVREVAKWSVQLTLSIEEELDTQLEAREGATRGSQPTELGG